MLDYGVIAPRLHALYDWSARELDIPDLRNLIRDGSPIYAWSYADRKVWRQAPESLLSGCSESRRRPGEQRLSTVVRNSIAS